MSFRFGFRRLKAATPFGILMLRAAKLPISAPSAAASRRLRSETRLRAQSAEVLTAVKRSNAAKRHGPEGPLDKMSRWRIENLKYLDSVLIHRNPSEPQGFEGFFCLKTVLGELSRQVQQSVEEDFSRGPPDKAFTRT